MGSPASIIIPIYGRQKRLALTNSGSGTLAFTGTMSTTSPTISSVSPDPSGLSPGTVLLIPTGAGGFSYATVLSTTTTTIVLTANAPLTGSALQFQSLESIGGLLNGAKFHLWFGSYSPSVITTLADMTPLICTFSGYSDLTLTMTSGAVVANVPQTQSQLLRWFGTTGAVTNSVAGFWADDGEGVLAVGSLASAVGMGPAGTEIALVMQDSYPPGVQCIQVTP